MLAFRKTTAYTASATEDTTTGIIVLSAKGAIDGRRLIGVAEMKHPSRNRAGLRTGEIGSI